MSFKGLRVLLYALLLVGLSFCTESPENDGNSQAAPPRAKAPTLGNGASGSDQKSLSNEKYNIQTNVELFGSNPELFDRPGEQHGVGSEKEEALKQKNLRAPIVYGVGASNITMDTSFAEAKGLLTPPFRGPYENGLAFYNEQLVVIWKSDGERKPELIVAQKGYLGQMEVGGKFGTIDFQTKFTEYIGSDPQAGAARLLVELFNQFENIDDPSYNCIQQGRCLMFFGTNDQANVLLRMPGADILIAKEEFQIAEIRIKRDIDPGILANNLDIIEGKILVPDMDPIPLGISKAELFQAMEASGVKSSPDVYVDPDEFIYRWAGVYLLFNRSNFANNVSKAEDQDFSTGVQVTPEFPAALTVNGQPLFVFQDNGFVKFSQTQLAPPAQDTPESQSFEQVLSMNTLIPRENSLKFAQFFSKFLKQELNKKYSTVFDRMYGQQLEEKEIKDYSASIFAFDNDLSGRILFFGVSEESKRMNYFGVTEISPETDPFAKLILPAMKDDLAQDTAMVALEKDPNNFDPFSAPQMVFNKLSGIELNEAVRLTQVDHLGRGEATVTFLDEKDRKLGEMTERGGFTERGSFDVPVDGRPSPRTQSYVSVGVNNSTVLGLLPIGADQQGVIYRIVSLSSANIYGEIKNLCGLGDELSFKITMSDKQVLNQLSRAIDTRTAKDSNFKCDHFKVTDIGDKGRVQQIYFPDQRIILNFSDRTLVSVSIYLPENELNLEMPEVAQ